MSKVHFDDESNTIKHLKSPNPIDGNLTWLRHNINKQSGLIDLMILQGNYSIDDMIDELINHSEFKRKNRKHWYKRIEDHIQHLNTIEGDSRNKKWGPGGHNLRVTNSVQTNIVFFDYPI